MPRESSTKRRSVLSRISAHRACQSRSSCIRCSSSISRMSHASSREGSAKPASAAFSRRTSRPSNSVSASAVFPKPHGALKKSTLPRLRKVSNACVTEDLTIMALLSVTGFPPCGRDGIVPRGTPWDSEGTLAVINLCPIDFFFYCTKVIEKSKSVQSRRRFSAQVARLYRIVSVLEESTPVLALP